VLAGSLHSPATTSEPELSIPPKFDYSAEGKRMDVKNIQEVI
jgi:hypothetical protein